MKTSIVATAALCVAAFIQVATADVKAAAAAAAANFEAKMADQAKNLNKFMPNPTGPGFKDKGITGDADFQQMDRFGIPDLNNPTAIELTDLNFDKAIEGEKYVGVLFYAPTMPDYEFYALHWEKASMEIGENLMAFTTANITMARLDISEPEHQEIAETYQVSHERPDMRLFFNGTQLTPILSPVAHHDIRQFIIAQTIPSVMLLSDETGLKKWKRRKMFNQANIKFLAHFTEEAGDLAQYKAVASELKTKVQFAYVQSLDLLRIGVTDVVPNGIYLLRDFATPQSIQFEGELSVENVKAFIEDYNMPLLTNMGDKDEYKIRNFLEHKKRFRALTFFKTEAARKAATPALEALAREFADQVLVAYTVEDPEDAMNFDYQFWNVPSDKPALLVVNMKRDRKYVLSSETAHDLEQMRSLVHDVLSDRANAELKSQEPPTPNTGLVRIIVTKTWKEEVIRNRDQDVLVLLTRSEAHPPSKWMTHHLERFAKVWRREKNILVAKMDMSQNDLLELDDEAWTQLPRLYYVPKNRKRLDIFMKKTYPTMEEMMEFVTSHQSTELQVDSKVWTRVNNEDKEMIAKHKAEVAAGAEVQAPEEILKELEEELNAFKRDDYAGGLALHFQHEFHELVHLGNHIFPSFFMFGRQIWSSPRYCMSKKRPLFQPLEKSKVRLKVSRGTRNAVVITIKLFVSTPRETQKSAYLDSSIETVRHSPSARRRRGANPFVCMLYRVQPWFI
ncbi:hypothetical protein Ae201684P_004782 [Aphanomyces euteiches]|nr:hypothetical protein Ae201684P_004782 [Aphanomyces euteiches]